MQRIAPLALLLISAPAASAGAPFVVPSLLAPATPQPGAITPLSVRFKPRPGWHIYSNQPGDVGYPPRITWVAPAGVTFGPLQHPPGQRVTVGTLVSYVHPGVVDLVTQMRLPRSLKSGSRVVIRGDVEWLSCSDSQCVPEKASISLAILVGPSPSKRL